MNNTTNTQGNSRLPKEKVLSFIDECNSGDEETVCGWDDSAKLGPIRDAADGAAILTGVPNSVTILASSFNGSTHSGLGSIPQSDKLKLRRKSTKKGAANVLAGSTSPSA